MALPSQSETPLSSFTQQLGPLLGNYFCVNAGPVFEQLRQSLAGNLSRFPTAYDILAATIPYPCGTRPPAQPSIPPQGGQCPGVLYRVTFTLSRPNGAIFGPVEFQNVIGPITSVGLRFVNFPNFGEFGIFVDVVAPNDTEPPTPGTRSFGPNFFGDTGRTTRLASVTIARMDGQPDTCGDAPQPPDPPTPPPPPFQLPPVNVQVGPDTVVFSPTFQFSPSIFAPVFGGLLIPVRVNIAPNISFPVGINIPFYLRFPDFVFNTEITGVEPQVIIESGGGGGGCDCDDIRAIVFEELDSKFPPSRPNTGQVVGYGAANSRDISLPDFSTQVRIQLIDVPENAKRQAGFNGPDVVYAGWYAFGWGTPGGDRHPINYLDQSVEVPEGADRFTYTLYNGFTATTSIAYLQEV